AIYGYFATQIGRYFFPHEDAIAQLLSAFGVFAIGYLMRPIGGVIVGHIGDSFGRRAALIFSVAALAIPTFLFGGLSPLLATWLVERTGNEIAPSFLMMASAAVTFVTIFWFRETYRTSFGVAPTAAA